MPWTSCSIQYIARVAFAVCTNIYSVCKRFHELQIFSVFYKPSKNLHDSQICKTCSWMQDVVNCTFIYNAHDIQVQMQLSWMFYTAFKFNLIIFYTMNFRSENRPALKCNLISQMGLGAPTWIFFHPIIFHSIIKRPTFIAQCSSEAVINDRLRPIRAVKHYNNNIHIVRFEKMQQR